jgi:hypothetical protein
MIQNLNHMIFQKREQRKLCELIKIFFTELKPGLVTHTCNPSTQETEAGELGV